MEYVIAWCGFVGAWLLVAGPIYQAAVELAEESIDREALSAAGRAVPPPRAVSPWWWLLPPVGYLLTRHRTRLHHDAVFHAMSPSDRERWVSFRNKATGWIFVAGGAFFIAIKETWELVEAYHWPELVVLGLVLIMVVASAMNTVLRVRASGDRLGQGSGRSRR